MPVNKGLLNKLWNVDILSNHYREHNGSVCAYLKKSFIWYIAIKSGHHNIKLPYFRRMLYMIIHT